MLKWLIIVSFGLSVLAAAAVGGRVAWRRWGPKAILLAGVLLFLLAGLFPPWLSTCDVPGVHSRKDAGHRFILAAPAPVSNAPAYGIALDVQRLAVEWVCVAVGTGAGWVAAAGLGRSNRSGQAIKTPYKPI